MPISNQPADLTAVAEQFSEWRANKTGHAKIPDELWQSVFSLLNHTKIGVIATTLKLSYAQIRSKLEKQKQNHLTENELVPVTLIADHPSITNKTNLSGIPVKIILNNGVNIQCHLSKEMIYTIMTGGEPCCK